MNYMIQYIETNGFLFEGKWNKLNTQAQLCERVFLHV